MTPSGEVTSAGSWLLGDCEIQRMGYGAMRLAQHGHALVARADSSPRGESLQVLRRTRELGINHIDTAAFYFSPLRSANELINSALAPYEEDLVIVTKVGPSRGPSGEWLPVARPDELRGQVEENLRQLGRDHLDVVNYRRQLDVTSVSEYFGALAELRSAGLIRHLGLSGVDLVHVEEAQAIAPVVCVQNSWGIGSGESEVLHYCAENNIAFVPFFSIAGSGRASGAGALEPPELEEIARSHGVTSAQVRLAWSLAYSPNVVLIPGTGSLEHLEENVAAAQLRLSDPEMATLSALSSKELR